MTKLSHQVSLEVNNDATTSDQRSLQNNGAAPIQCLPGDEPKAFSSPGENWAALRRMEKLGYFLMARIPSLSSTFQRGDL
jgi:hypothetical protein